MAGRKTIVFFDLKTTDRNSRLCHVIQLSAVCGGNVFDGYTLPLRPIHPKAEQLTGFTVRDRRLYRDGELIKTDRLNQLLTSFIDFLSDFPGPVLLAAHSAKRFDVPILKRLLRRFGLERRFWGAVSGFLDTMQDLSRTLPDGPRSHSLPELVKHFLGYDYDDCGPHDALDDAFLLQDLFYWWTSSRWDFSTFQ